MNRWAVRQGPTTAICVLRRTRLTIWIAPIGDVRHNPRPLSSLDVPDVGNANLSVSIRRIDHAPAVHSEGVRWLQPAKLLLASLGLILVGIAVMPWDTAASRFLFWGKDNLPSAVEVSAEVYESFGHGYGVAAILVAICILDPIRRRLIPWLVACSLGAGMASNCVKFLVFRQRPRRFDLNQDIAGSFEQWVPGFTTKIGLHSLPSSHTATAFGLALGLAWMYPRGRWFFLVMASFVGLSRVITGAHFVSDTFWGAAVATIVSAGVLKKCAHRGHDPQALADAHLRSLVLARQKADLRQLN